MPSLPGLQNHCRKFIQRIAWLMSAVRPLFVAWCWEAGGRGTGAATLRSREEVPAPAKANRRRCWRNGFPAELRAMPRSAGAGDVPQAATGRPAQAAGRCCRHAKSRRLRRFTRRNTAVSRAPCRRSPSFSTTSRFGGRSPMRSRCTNGGSVIGSGRQQRAVQPATAQAGQGDGPDAEGSWAMFSMPGHERAFTGRRDG